MAKKTEKTETTPTTEPKPYVLNLPAGFKTKATLSAKLWKWEDGQPKYFRIESEMIQKSAIKTKDGKDREPATTCSVVDLTQPNSSAVTLIMGAVLAGLLRDSYKDNGYVGKSFAVTRYQQPGKRYKSFEVQELESA